MEPVEEEQYYEPELTPEQKRKIARNQLKCFNIIIWLCGAGLCAFGYWVGTEGRGGAWSAFVVAGLGLGIVLMTCVGCCGAFSDNAVSHKLLLLYYTLTLLASVVALVAGGFCFILTDQAVAFVQDNWDQISIAENVDVSADAIASEVRLNLMIAGGACFLVMFLLLCAMSNVVRLVSPLQAFTLMLQASTMTMLPFGIVLIAAAMFVADTAASAEAPITAFAIFIMGAFVIALSLLGCLSVAIASRGLIKLFMICVALLMLLFFAFGITSFVQAETLQEQIVNNWDTIRRVLPPTFSGKYDQGQFTSFLEANLKAVGYISLCMGVLMAAEVYASMKLRAAMKEEDEEETGDQWGDGGAALPHTAFRATASARFDVKREWKRRWTKGSKKSKCWIRCACCCICFVLLLIVAISTAILYFSVACSTLSDVSDITSYKPPGEGVATIVQVYNNYTRGVTQGAVVAGQEGFTLKFEKSAFRKNLGADTAPPVQWIGGDTLNLQADPKAPFEVVGFDFSCQIGTTTIEIPDKSVVNGDSYESSKEGLAVEMITNADFAGQELVLKDNAPRFKIVTMSTTQGPVTLDGVKLGAEGASLKSTSGELFITGVDAIGNPVLMGEAAGGLVMDTVLGSIRVQQSTFVDTELEATGGAALISLDSVTCTTTQGAGALIKLSSEKGLIEAKTTQADEFDLVSVKGNIKLENVVIHESLKAATSTGNVIATGLKAAPRASIQIETTSGAVTVKLTEFAGFISLHSAAAVVVTGKDQSHFADVQETTVENMHSFTATVNCATKDNCPYLGELLVTSDTGTISLTVDVWDQVPTHVTAATTES